MADHAAKWTRSLAAAAARARALDVGDQEAVAELGAGLEELWQSVPDGLPGVGSLMERCLYGLQVLYQGGIAQPADLAAAISEALAAMLGVADGSNAAPNAMLREADRLETLLLASEHERGMAGTDGSEAPAAGEAPAPEAVPASLDDVASRLVLLEGDATEEWTLLQAALARLVPGLPRPVQDVLAPACVDLASFLAAGGDGDALRRELGGALEQALLLLEEGGPANAQRRRPAADAKPATAEPVAADVDPEADHVESELPTEIVLGDDADPEFIGEFLTESNEYIEDSEGALLTLESDPQDMEAVNRVFRAFHTIKGTSAFLGLDAVSELAHKAETVLSRVRDGEIQFTHQYADLALRSVDMLKDLLVRLQDRAPGDCIPLPADFANLLFDLMHPESAAVDPSTKKRDAAEAAAATPRADARAGMEAAAGEGAAAKASSRIESSVRVRTDRLDRLIDMVGELVIAHSIVAQDEVVDEGRHHDLAKKVAHTGKIVRDLQDLSMSMRMVPLKGTFQKMARLVRDLAVKGSKEVQFQRIGEDTEIDRNMVDLINDPLVHMIRNAVDHGIEPPDERAAADKPRQGRVILTAYHAGGNVIVELADDGRGLDRRRIVDKAVERGIIESDKGMSDTDVFNLIFEAGFSTAARVTDVSGRGVGMDVVRRNIESLHGRVDISSRLGRGTTFSVRLPLTMAITDGMLVCVGDQRYIVPSLNIQMNLRPERDNIATVLKQGEMLKLRGDLLPLYRLHRIFGISGAIENPCHGAILVMDDGDVRFAVLVDELLGKLQVVTKPLGNLLGRVPGISGGAILGDGRVGLILDPAGLSNLARNCQSSGSECAGAVGAVT
ncbi:MAG: chemotaxis protein CheA [Candidatus Krumholzibacteriota bacterium]|nr:chemotaxis protein CheA [Candidatus Krumholzibacteriota bacterium]